MRATWSFKASSSSSPGPRPQPLPRPRPRLLPRPRGPRLRSPPPAQLPFRRLPVLARILPRQHQAPTRRAPTRLTSAAPPAGRPTRPPPSRRPLWCVFLLLLALQRLLTEFFFFSPPQTSQPSHVSTWTETDYFTDCGVMNVCATRTHHYQYTRTYSVRPLTSFFFFLCLISNFLCRAAFRPLHLPSSLPSPSQRQRLPRRAGTPTVGAAAAAAQTTMPGTGPLPVPPWEGRWQQALRCSLLHLCSPCCRSSSSRSFSFFPVPSPFYSLCFVGPARFQSVSSLYPRLHRRTRSLSMISRLCVRKRRKLLRPFLSPRVNRLLVMVALRRGTPVAPPPPRLRTACCP